MIIRSSMAQSVALASLGAIVSPATPGHAVFAHANQCLYKRYSAKERGLTRTRNKWSEIVSQEEGSRWADITAAADYIYKCEDNGKVNVCVVVARPCWGPAKVGIKRPDNFFRKD